MRGSHSSIGAVRILYVGVSSKGVHLFSFRTQKLSPSEAMVVVKARVAQRQHRVFEQQKAHRNGVLFVILV